VRIELAGFAAGAEQLASAGIEFLFVDTPHSVRPELRTLLGHTSIAVVPVRPSTCLD
jgi:chromosome partitioning protein